MTERISITMQKKAPLLTLFLLSPLLLLACHDWEKFRHCVNNKLDYDESDIDCGGDQTPLSCDKCADDKKCRADIDCVSGACLANVCVPHCLSRRKDENETGVDCGGGDCPLCKEGVACLKDWDCAGYCNGMSCVPLGFTKSEIPLPEDGRPVGLVTADFDADSKRDVAVALANISSAAVVWGQTRKLVKYELCAGCTGTNSVGVATARFDEDPRTDFLVAEAGQLHVKLYSNGTDFTNRVGGDSKTQITAVALGDIDQDGYPDLFGASTEGILAFRGMAPKAAKAFETPMIHLPKDVASVAVADLTGDGLPEVLLGLRHDAGMSIIPNKGGQLDWNGAQSLDVASLAFPGTPSSTVAIESILIEDFDGDQKKDVLLRTSEQKHSIVVLFARDGQPSFTAASYSMGDFAVSAMATGDINGDLCPDVVVLTEYGAPSSVHVAALLNRRNDKCTGVLQQSYDRETGLETAYAVAVDDLDNRGNRDWVVAGEKRENGQKSAVLQYWIQQN